MLKELVKGALSSLYFTAVVALVAIAAAVKGAVPNINICLRRVRRCSSTIVSFLVTHSIILYTDRRLSLKLLAALAVCTLADKQWRRYRILLLVRQALVQAII